MADAWTAQLTADVNSYGWTTTVTSVNNMKPNLSVKGESIAVTRNNIAIPPQDIEVFSEAKDIIEKGQKTNLNNIDPLVYVSIPKNRVKAFAYFSEFTFPNLFTTEATDDYGNGGWTALKIIDDVMTRGTTPSFSYDDAFSGFDYDVSFYRVAPYQDIRNIFESFFNKVPIIYSLDSSGMITAKLLPISTINPDFTKGNITVRYVPKPKKHIIVEGGLGPPLSTYNSSNLEFTASATPPEALPCVWASSDTDSVGGYDNGMTEGATVDFIKLSEGKLSSKANINTNYVKQIAVDFTPANNVGLVGTHRVSQKRHEVVFAGMPLFTLANTQESFIDSTTTNATQNRNSLQEIITTTALRGTLIAAGEGDADLKPITDRKVSCTYKLVYIGETAASSSWKWILNSVSVTNFVYEDMFTTSRDVIDTSAAAGVVPGVGRLKLKVESVWEAYIQRKAEFDAGRRYDCYNINYNDNVNTLKANEIIVMYNTKVLITSVDPLGSTGYTNTTSIATYNPSTGHKSFEMKDTGGDSGAYVSQLQFANNSIKIRVHAGDGEPEFVSIPACSNPSHAQRYADKILSYRGSYFEVNQTLEERHCDQNGTISITYPSDKPGEIGDYGTITAISVTATPDRSNTMYSYRMFEPYT